jgi:Tfp pilus assembly protein PilF
MRALEAAQRIARETSNVSAVAWALFNMGTVHRQEGRLDEAAASLQQAADILRGEPGACGLSDVMTALADVHMRRGEGKSARRTLREAMGLGGCLRQSKAMERARRRLAELERLRRSGPDLPDDASG